LGHGIESTAKSRARIQRIKAGVSILPVSGVGWEWMGKDILYCLEKIHYRVV